MSQKVMNWIQSLEDRIEVLEKELEKGKQLKAPQKEPPKSARSNSK